MGSCKKTNVPTVNEDAVECHGLIPTNCVVLSEAVQCLQAGKGATLTSLLVKLCNKISDLESQIEEIQNNG